MLFVHAFLPAALAAWSWDGLECCSSCCCSLGTLGFWYEFSNLSPAIFLCMANLKTLSEIVRFSNSSRFTKFFWFTEFSDVQNILIFRFSEVSRFSELFRLSDFFHISFRGLKFSLISLSHKFYSRPRNALAAAGGL